MLIYQFELIYELENLMCFLAWSLIIDGADFSCRGHKRWDWITLSPYQVV